MGLNSNEGRVEFGQRKSQCRGENLFSALWLVKITVYLCRHLCENSERWEKPIDFMEEFWSDQNHTAKRLLIYEVPATEWEEEVMFLTLCTKFWLI